MKGLVIYDSWFGNTKRVARQVSDTLDIKAASVDLAALSDLKNLELLIVGSPVHGGRATPVIEEFLDKIPAESLKNIKVSAFDTRFEPRDHALGVRIIMNITHFAAEKIAKELVEKGGDLIVKPEGFIVNNKRGPLKSGEIDRAIEWARKIASSQDFKKNEK